MTIAGFARMTHAVGFHYDFNGDRGAANPHKLCVKADQIAYVHRRDKDYFVHGFSHDLFIVCLRTSMAAAMSI